jgi:UDP-glucose 4-epimerase
MRDPSSTQADRPNRVVVLGKRGFIATYLTRHLAGLGVPCDAVGKDEVNLIDPSSVDKLERIVREGDAVVIASALTPDKGRDFRVLMKNLRMAEHLCEVFEKRPCAHVIYLSSDAVYDAHKIPLDEDSSREPVDLHGLMHTAREMMLGRVLAAKGIPYCILRPVNIYGFGDTHNSYGPNRFVREAFNDRKITIFGGGEERRCHLYIEDAVRLIGLFIERRSTGSFNLAPPSTAPFLRVAEMIRTACPFPVGIEFKARAAPPIHRPYNVTQVFRFIYNLGRPISPIVHRPYVVTKLRKAFPEFWFTPMRDAVEEYVRQYREAAGTAAGTGPRVAGRALP